MLLVFACSKTLLLKERNTPSGTSTAQLKMTIKTLKIYIVLVSNWLAGKL